jgi:hypothetical protein
MIGRDDRSGPAAVESGKDRLLAQMRHRGEIVTASSRSGGTRRPCGVLMALSARSVTTSGIMPARAVGY